MPDTVRPASPWALFVAFSLLALQGFGGVIAIAQRVVVEQRRWLTPDEATSPGVQPGVERSSRNGLLLFDVLTQDFDWRSTTRRGEVGRGPQNAPALQPRMEVPEFLAQQAR